MLQTIRQEDRNILIFYYLSFARSASFLVGNWIFFWLRVMTYGQLGVVDATAFAFGLVMEIPTGAISDMVGKRFTLMWAMLLNGAGFIIMGASDTLPALVVGFWITQIGWALYSGADEAMAYDSLQERADSARFDQVISTSNVIGIVTLVISTLIGGVMYNIDIRLPHYAWGIILISGFFVANFIREPKVKRDPFTLNGYARQLLRGVHQLGRRDLRPFLPLIFGILGISYLFGFGLVQYAVAADFGFLADGQAVVFAVIAALTAVATAFVPALRQRFSEMTLLIALALLMAAGFFGAALPLGLLGFFALLCIRTAGAMATPWVSIIVNHKIPSEDRATTLSTVALVTKIPYVLTAIIAGKMAEEGSLWLFNLAVVGFILMVIGLSMVIRARMPVSSALATAPYAELETIPGD